MSQDEEHLRLLSIFHYVLAGIIALFACFPTIHLALGLMLTNIPAVMIVLGWGFAVCILLAGRYLARHDHYTFCLVMAAVNCVFMPLGTALGVFTIIVLVRPSVKALFDGQTSH